MSQRQWMEAKRPKPGVRQAERVLERIKRGARDTEINQCCAECRAALKWLVRTGKLSRRAATPVRRT